MRIGLINQLHGQPDSDPPRWETIRKRAQTAEAVGFDIFVYEDALMYRGEESTQGVWEAVSVSGALAASTSTIDFGPSVFNAPYRSPAMLAKIADTLDEISGGRFVLGIGAGNTPDSDYEAFGFPTDRRYSRFAEAIEIIHTLLKEGSVTFDGQYASAHQAELVLRGPLPEGPPITIAAGGPKMIDLAARYGDAWNWWTWGEPLDPTMVALSEKLRMLDEACEAIGRDPTSITRTLDLYTVAPMGTDGLDMEHPVTGSIQQIADHLQELAGLGFTEIRCDLYPKSVAAIEAMQPVVELMHRG